MSKSERGAALIDVVCTAGLVTVLAGIVVPVTTVLRERDAARSAGRYVASTLQHARIEAIRRNTRVAVRFDREDPSRMAVFADGDADGVSEADIAEGIDVPVREAARLSDLFRGVEVRLNQDVPDPEDGRMLAAGSDALRIGSTHLVSFSPLGTSTSGTVYLAAAVGPQAAVRLLGTTGRLRVLMFDAGSGQWTQE
jgi:hypothetical protein